MLAYTKKHALDLGERFEGTYALMRQKTPDVQFRIRFASYNVGTFWRRSEKIDFKEMFH